MRKSVTIACLTGLLGISAASADITLKEWAKWDEYLVPNPMPILPPSGLQKQAMVQWINVKALADSTFALIINATNQPISEISCGGYAISGSGAYEKYHNPSPIAPHSAAIINFEEAPRHCSGTIDISFEDGSATTAKGDKPSIKDSTRVVVNR